MTLSIEQPEPSKLALLWPQIEPLIAPAVERTDGRMLTVDVLSLLLLGKARAWVAVDDGKIIGVLIADGRAYPRLRALNVIFIAGVRRKTWQALMIETLEGQARKSGFHLIEGLGRQGWGRVLPGYRVTGVSVEKVL